MRGLWTKLRKRLSGRTYRVTHQMIPHFVISSPRSGSTWLSRALNAHPQILGTENRLFGNFAEFWPEENGAQRGLRITLDHYVHVFSAYFNYEALRMTRDEFQSALIVQWCRSLMDLCYERTGKAYLIDKITPYLGTSSRVVKLIRQYFPEAKIVHLIRDGRDVLVSGVFDWLKRQDHGKDRYKTFVENKRTRLERFLEDEDIERWTQYWIQPTEAVTKHAPNALTVQYENMLKNQARELKRILDYLDIETTDRVLQDCIEASSFNRMSGGRKRGEELATAKVRKGVSGDWERWFVRGDGELFWRRAGHQLAALGYEKDAAWVKALPEVLPQD